MMGSRQMTQLVSVGGIAMSTRGNWPEEGVVSEMGGGSVRGGSFRAGSEGTVDRVVSVGVLRSGGKWPAVRRDVTALMY